MTLAFPNQSRSYDEARHGVRFTGYDGMFEVPFLVEATALQQKGASAASETSCLATFDALRDLIQNVAREVYSNGRQTIYYITAADMR
jgi:hypothetical protein